MRITKLCAIALTPFLLNAAMPAKNTQSQTTENGECLSPLHVMHADVRHTESKGVGYNKGYTTLEWFGIYDCNPNFMPFLDLRGHVFNDGQLAANVGLGERTVMSSINHIFGLYLYYDVRQEDHGLTVNQLSPGIEVLGKRMEYRVNAYFPVGETESKTYHHKFEKFEGNRMMIKSRKKYAMTGVDGEVGAHITQSTRHDFYFGVGPYFFTDEPSNAWGGKGRLYYHYKDYVSLEASYSYDHIFKNVVQGTIAFSYPFGKKLSRKGKNCPNSNDLALSRAAFAPYRFEIPVVETHHRSKAAKSPVTHKPFNVWFVDNTSHSSGTIESPFSTLADAQNASGTNDIIYVFPGDGTTNGMNQGITLKNGQFLFGSATPQNVKTTVGNITIPAQSKVMPSIINANGQTNVINLANGNEISGINVRTLGDVGIGNGANPIVGASIHNNIISGPFDHLGVLIANVSGNISVTDNVFSNPVAPGGPGTAAIAINISDGSFSQVNVSNNNILGYEDGVSFGISGLFSAATTASGSVTITGNTINSFGNQGVVILKGMPNAPFNISNNTINDTRSTGAGHGGIVIPMTAAQSNSGNFNISGNTITTTSTAVGGTPCISINSTATTNARFSIQNNNLSVSSTAGSYGLNMNAGANSVFCVTAANLNVTAPAGVTGISISGNTGTVNIDQFSNIISPAVLFSGNVNEVASGTCGQ